MPSIPGAVGGSSVLRQPFIDCEEAINWFPETIQAGVGKRQRYQKSRAGLRPFAEVEDSPGRGLFSQDGRTFAAVGSTFSEIMEDGTTIPRGTIETSDLTVWMCSNGSAGHQIFLVAYPYGYIFDLNTADFTQLSGDFPENVWQPVFMDGYFLVSIRDSRQFRWSALEDGLTWDPLNVAERSIGSDNIVSFLRSHRELWVIGSRTSEVWYDQGDPLIPFAPIQGVFLEMGSGAGYSAQRTESTVMWIGQNELGGGVVYVANGYTPDKISTYPIDLELQDSGNLEFVSASAFQQKGHRFYQINLPPNEAPLSPVFDIGEGIWHHRAMWSTTSASFSQDLAAAHCYAWAKNLMVSRSSGFIYWLRDDVYDDDVEAADKAAIDEPAIGA